ncbi:migration and invasion-inhibitory protein [Cyclopterus lumpus]|uniref:migration and invasion-inhibitory protein n=1 Tax=Cyclopterus lumpus TaxID=8103 RepID=UPI001485F5A5|nr:migration and invasion-inhibitory protein [Cyclopterus lumpus]
MTDNRLDVLRERNKELLNRLKQRGEKLERLNGCSQSHKREREGGAEERRGPAETRSDGGRGPARAALARRTVRFTDTCERQTGIRSTISTPSSTSKYRRGTSEHAAPSDQLTGSVFGMREVRSRVTFQSDECEEISASDRHRVQPLLGYDWIAGVLDAEDSLIERSDEFFNDLHTFRSLNKDECVHNPQEKFPEENLSVLPLLTDKNDPEADTATHQCTFSYRINSRLFPVPLHSQECCPVCKEHKSSQPHTTVEPALIRVTIPRSTLLPPYKYKAHRRCSFDPSDSVGLPSHCLSGWSNTGQSTLPPSSSLDLQSSLNMKSSTGSQNKELEDSAPKVSGKVSDQMSDLSCLARHNFQHFSSKRKPGSMFYPLH